ncbi:MAG: hypothetical protein KAT15_14620 [Bacteroidales bacterium]|nr:hypothetical protein [Bacteroidales bacterium]
MKTTNQTTKRFPDVFRMILYVATVAALGLLNCYIVKAGDPDDADYANRLDAAVNVQAEPEIRLEGWMLNFNDEVLAEVEDEEDVLEDWMLDPAYWVIPDYLIVEKEEEPVLEDWMLDPGYYVIEPLLIAKSDE